MIHKLAVIGLGVSCLVSAGDEPRQKILVSNTEHIDFPPDGVLRLTNSIGELTIEGQDRSDVVITTIMLTKAASGSRGREKATHELDKVRVATERDGNELVITTAFLRHRGLPPPSPLGGATDFKMEYNIKVPRKAHLFVDHDIGEVHVENVTGDIHVTSLQGSITLRLPENGQYAVDAKSDFGSVTSDFPGREKRRFWLVGHQVNQNISSASQNLYLRIGFGDILILRVRRPPTLAPLGQ
jgi:hypothetical protein